MNRVGHNKWLRISIMFLQPCSDSVGFPVAACVDREENYSSDARMRRAKMTRGTGGVGGGGKAIVSCPLQTMPACSLGHVLCVGYALPCCTLPASSIFLNI